MAKKYYFHCLTIGLVVFLGFVPHGQAVTLSPTKPPVVALDFPDEMALRMAIADTAASYVGIKERTNRNDHPVIAKINRKFGLPANAYYCASGLAYCYKVNIVGKLPFNGAGSVASWFANRSRWVYKRGERGNQRTGRKPQLMDGVSLFTSHIEGLASARWDSEADYIETIGFNTTAGTGRGGVYRVRRPIRDVKAIVNHITPYWESLHKIK
jgi:hypothetical protein